MKRITYPLAIFCSCAAFPAFAACTDPLVVKDGNSASQNMSVKTGADGNCQSQFDVDTSSNVYNALTAPVPSGTNVIGKLGIDQTTPGTTNGVQVNAAIPAGTNLMGKVGIDQTTPGVTNGVTVTTALPSGTNVIGFASNDPCAQKIKTPLAFGQQATTFQLIAGVSGQKIYVCSFVSVFAGASVLNIIEGTGATCVTSNELAVVGSTTAANGLSFAANGGYSQGSGAGSIMVTTNASSGLCILQNGNNTVAGNLTFVQQ